MNTKKIIAKAVSITLLSTSLLSSTSINASAYSYEIIHKTGYIVSRTYGITNNLNTTYNNPSSKYVDNNDTNTNSDSINSYSSTNYSDTSQKENSSYSFSSNTYSSNNYYYSGGEITRYYGPNPQSDSSYQTKKSNNNVTTTNGTTHTENSNTTTQNKMNTKPTDSSSVYKMLTLINDERTKSGLKPLTLNDKLTSVAQLKAEDMAKNNYLSHTSPTYGSIYTMIRNAGISFYNVGENIATAYSIENAHRNFMNSYIHRNAILAPHFAEVGIGIAKTSTGMHKISVMFIDR
ncbi:MAG: hypothetical protein PWQ37_1287 [Candidatus Petromonas sp.]|jgi:uncharacterized protein YkwD|nr:hypothetical protein [Candidatus Petromonas sp.]